MFSHSCICYRFHTCSVIDCACPRWFVFSYTPPPPPMPPRHTHILALSGVAVKVAQRCFSLAKCNWRERSTELWFTGPGNTDTQGYTPLFLHLCILDGSLHPFIPISSVSAITPFTFCTALSPSSQGSQLTLLSAGYLFLWSLPRCFEFVFRSQTDFLLKNPHP